MLRGVIVVYYEFVGAVECGERNSRTWYTDGQYV